MDRIGRFYTYALCALTIFFLFNVRASAHHPHWRKFGELQYGRYYFGATYIGNGEVLVAGGLVKSHSGKNTVKDISSTNSCEIINTWQGSIYPVASMLSARAEFPSLLTKDSDVVVIGGVIKNPYNVEQSKNTALVEIFDRKTREWKVVGSLLIARRQHTAIFINDEEILVVGGRMDNLDGTRSTEIFNIRTGISRRAADYPYPINNARLEKTSTGRIIVFGGRESGPNGPHYEEVYEYKSEYDLWISPITLLDSRSRYVNAYGIACVKLWDQSVVLCSGSESEGIEAPQFRKDIWIERNNTLTPLGHIHDGRYDHGGHIAAQLSMNTIVICGGFGNQSEILRSTEVIDIQTGSVVSVFPLIEPHSYTKVINIPGAIHKETEPSRNTVLCISGISFIKHDARGNFDSIHITPAIELLELPECREETAVSGFSSGNFYGAARLDISSTLRDTALLLTPDVPSLSSAFFSREQVAVSEGFRSSFSFILENGSDNNIPDSSSPGGDGLAFVIHNSFHPIDIQSAQGRGMGYTGIPNSLAVEFDMYKNPNFKDPDGNHIAIQCNGKKENSARHSKETTLGYTSAIPIFKSDVLYYAAVVYKNHRLEVYIEDIPLTEKTTPRLVLENIDLESLLELNQGSAYVGFTASTGRASQKHSLFRWNFAPCRVVLE